MVSTTGNNLNFTGTGRKEAEKSLDSAENCRKEREVSQNSIEKIRRLFGRNTSSPRYFSFFVEIKYLVVIWICLIVSRKMEASI
jgi:hypothetical protein